MAAFCFSIRIYRVCDLFRWDLLDDDRLHRQINQLHRCNWLSLRALLGVRLFSPGVPCRILSRVEILHKIATVPDIELHRAMGSMFFDLMGSNTKGLAVMRLVALHPNVAPPALELLSSSEDEYVLGTVAANEKLSEATIKRLFDKGGYLIEWGLAVNKHTPTEILGRLARSANEYIRAGVAGNPRSSPDDLAMLSQDSTWNVRGNVALNPSTSREIVIRLSQDSDHRVQQYARGLSN